MNIILKSFLLSLVIVIAVIAFSSISILPEIYGLIILVVVLFLGLWAYLYFLLK